MTHRVAQISTGNVGRQALAGILDHPNLELTGVWVSDPAKAGIDAATLAGLDGTSGVAATNDLDAIVAAKPDCAVYTAMTDNRLVEALEDLRRLLSAGINVVASAPVFLQYPHGVIPVDLIAPLEQATREGGTSLWVNGIDPGFANDLLPLALSGACRRIERIRCLEIVDYATYDSRTVVFDIMGFGQPMDHVPLLLQPTVLSLAWGSVVRQLAAGLGVQLDGVDEMYERVAAPTTFTVASGTIEKGTAAALRFEVRGLVDGNPVFVLEHVTRLRHDLAPEWPQPAQEGGSYRVEITGEPTYHVDLMPKSAYGDHNHGALVGTAMRIVNAIPAVVAAAPGILTALDLPQITGRGLVVTSALPQRS